MFASQAPQVWCEKGVPQVSLRDGFCRRWLPGALHFGIKQGSGLRKCPAIQFRRGVHFYHARFIDFSAKRLQRAPLRWKADRDIAAMQKQRLIAGKIGPVISENPQFVARYFCIRRIQIDDIHPSGGKRLVGDTVVQPHRDRAGQTVRPGQPGPPVLAGQKLVRETEIERNVAREIVDRANTQFIGKVFSHAQRVGIVESEWHGCHQPHGRQGPVQIHDRWIAVHLQHFTGNGAAVLGIDVDGIAAQGGHQDAGIAHALPVNRGTVA